MAELHLTQATFQDRKQALEGWLKKVLSPSIIHHIDEDGMTLATFIGELEPELYIQAWQGFFHKEARFSFHPVQADSPLLYMIRYVTNPEGYLIKESGPDSVKFQRINLRTSSILSTNKSELSIIKKEGVACRSIDILFSQRWLESYFPESRHSDLQNLLVKDGNQPGVFFEMISNNDFKVVTEILDKVFKNDWDFIFLKSRVMILINGMLENLTTHNKARGSYAATVQLETMMKVEKKLASMLHEKNAQFKCIGQGILPE